MYFFCRTPERFFERPFLDAMPEANPSERRLHESGRTRLGRVRRRRCRSDLETRPRVRRAAADPEEDESLGQDRRRDRDLPSLERTKENFGQTRSDRHRLRETAGAIQSSLSSRKASTLFSGIRLNKIVCNQN